LGLVGEVDGDTLGNVLRHADPSGVWRLTSSRSVPTVAAFDATFCAPKSVSLLHGLGEPEVSNEVRNAADAAVRAAGQVLETVACRVRRGAGGATVLDGDGFVGAGFRHRTSRAGDPHLHTHVVIANVVHCAADDRWTALDARPLYAWAAPVGYLYEAHLRWELTRRLGVRWAPVRNGIADVAGIDRAVLREFSTRRREIEAHLAEHGQSSAKAAQLATYATRRPKDSALDADSLRAGWWERARSHGLEPDGLAGVTGLSRRSVPEDVDALYDRLTCADGLTARASTFGERDVLKAICNALPDGAPVPVILDLAERFLASDRVVLVRGQDVARMWRADGTVVSAPVGESLWTTPELLELETRLAATAQAGQNVGAGLAATASLAAAVTGRPSMTDEQAQMVRAVCSSGHAVEVVEGAAGAGKTFALAAAREAWQASGFTVVGCALAARAAQQLEADAQIPSTTLHRLLADLDAGRLRLDRGWVVIVDEAAMVGTRQLVRLAEHAATAGAKVVLVGDPYQLPEIDAGGAFRGLQARLGGSQLTDNRRQSEPWERAALAELRTGDPDQVIDAYLAHGRVHTVTPHAQLVADWLVARAAVEDVLMVAGRMVDVDRLNRVARAVLQRRGELPADQVVLDGRGYAVGDQVLALRNAPAFGVLNGTRGTLVAIDTHRHELTLHTTNRQVATLPFAYADAGHLTHGYATTIHKAQGATVDRCLTLLDDTTTRQAAYTALSRGRYRNDAYLPSMDRRVEERHATGHAPDPLDQFRAAAARSGGESMAIDQRRARQRELTARLADGPIDVRGERASVAQDLEQAKNWLAGSEARRERLQAQLDGLPRVRHRATRRALTTLIEATDAYLASHRTHLRELEHQLVALRPAHHARLAWEHEHATELNELAALRRSPDPLGELGSPGTRVHQAEPDTGLGL
jgi:conjugative relaxase-like TrwC/TraI family protein